ncbi:MAG: hypothetical protein M1823_004307 [Watsoniomyces obsoletus]|nr:MAG: hypothetical protein M1823_004307 [Watsoniomyces obsoletus]
MPSREASLPTPDPPSDSATAALISDQSSYLVPTYARPSPMFVKGEGCYLWDLENRRYLDFTAGIAVNSLGHCDPGIGRVISQQVYPFYFLVFDNFSKHVLREPMSELKMYQIEWMHAKTLIHTSNLYHNPWVGTLSKKLIQTTQSSGAMLSASHAFISNSGTEANEAALKFCRKVGKTLQPSPSSTTSSSTTSTSSKHEIVSFQNSFHGRTLGALSATPNPKYQAPFAPMLPGFKYGVFNSLEDLEGGGGLINEKTCGVIVEPIQGEGGVNVASYEFLKTLRRKCDEFNAVLVFDEIQSGLSRTGYLWAHHRYEPPPSPQTQSLEERRDEERVEPDILTTAKALGNGFPIGATLVNNFVASKISIGDHGTTFGGNPLACRVGYAVLERLSDPSLQKHVRQMGVLLKSHLERLAKRFPELVADGNEEMEVVRGKGLIQGLQLRPTLAGVSRGGGVGGGDLTNKVINAARERGLLIISCGKDTLRFIPPLVLSKGELDEGMMILEDAMRSVLEESS